MTSRASQNPILPIRQMRADDLGSSLSMFKKVPSTKFSYQIMFMYTAAENIFVTS